MSTRPAAHAPSRFPASAGQAADAVHDFQLVMDQFLDLQRAMLPACLGATSPQPRRTGAPRVTAPVREIASAIPVAPLTERPAPATCGRYRVAIVDRPLPATRAPLSRDRVVVVTDDGGGVAANVRERLKADGYRVAMVASEITRATDAGRLVAQIVEQEGPIGALVHLMPLSPLRPSDTLDAEALSERLGYDTRTLFLLSQALGAELEGSAASGAALIACTSMGGLLGHGTEPGSAAPAFPGQAGMHGFIKCLALEWPDVRVRAVDLDPTEAGATLAGHVLDELWTADREREVGHAHGRRVGLDVVAAPVQIDADFDLPSDAVILATGGARGITADVCLELAERYQPTLVLVGQSPRPAPLEPPDTASLIEAADLKRALTQRLKASGERVNPAAVERAYRQLQKEREIRQNIGALTAAGARVHYVPLDVRDVAALGALVEDIYATYGRLDGVIHGAGVIEDKLVRDKSPDSFERVFGTKAVSAFVLARHLRPQTLRFLVFFSSVAGRFGNRGQADYAAANEVVGTLSLALNRRWPGRVCAIAWAPWDKRGMVSPELKREFLRRGIELVPPDAGRRACWAEIQQGGDADAQIVIGGVAPGAIAAVTMTRPAAEPSPGTPQRRSSLPLLARARRESGAPGTVRFHRVIDASVDRYLDDHRLDGHPVLPLAHATELMAEAAQAAWPEVTVVAVRRLQLFKGIVLEDGPVPVIVTVRGDLPGSADGLMEADVDITIPGAAPAVRYRAVIELASHVPEAMPFEPRAASLSPLPVPLDRACREWTFHGPMFQRVTQIAGIGPDALVGSIFSSTGVPVLEGVARPEWIFDPFVFDAALQLLLIWSRATNDMTALPSRFHAFRRYGSLSDHPLTCYVDIESSAGGHALKNDIHFVDGSGRLVAMLEGMEASCTAALNRLTARDGKAAR